MAGKFSIELKNDVMGMRNLCQLGMIREYLSTYVLYWT
jgi:hypothetical protein